MKKAKYKKLDGTDLEVEYDENAGCISCGLPVIEASMGGTALCPWCDCGVFRDGTKMTLSEILDKELLRKRAKEVSERLNEEKGANRG